MLHHDVRPLRGAIRLALDTLLPRLCPGCGGELSTRFWICLPCRRRFRRASSGPICFLCRERDRPGGDREAGYGCSEGSHEPWRGFAVFWMGDPLDRVIHAFKYEGRPDLARPLGRLLVDVGDGDSNTIRVPVPLHRRRRRERGYNQAALLAREAARRTGHVFLEEVVRRQRATRPQARLVEAEREANVRDAFGLVQPRLVRGRSFQVFDDVATTGSTLTAVTRVLAAGGATQVTPVVLALA